MTGWLGTAIVAVILALSCIYSYSLLQLFFSIRKCPDCGRIMQKVKYQNQNPIPQDRDTIVCECPFCQSKHFSSRSGKKLTLHP
ncbi:hypothetical protein LSG31_13465 [Fodinisporobacter ferrooxydans]|uniref:Uncharacterized protein n=1 Tax=Fodinisporobacter ferrooxydans TaxID=2901836 RepID=A0ABY4CFZ8_9BACL|nr:hypothetical protein LSG31_13465 [Alicyclobacillaceae bacterium MYW30-H2]